MKNNDAQSKSLDNGKITCRRIDKWLSKEQRHLNNTAAYLF